MYDSQLIDQLCPERPKAKSLIVTVYGDSLLPLGGRCWLGELIDLMAPFGLNERVTRTAVFRLVQDGVLEAERIGRRSRYTLTRLGRRNFDSAQARIYASEPPTRDGYWTFIVVPDGIAAAQRDQLLRTLSWQGFAKLSSGLLAAAQGDAEPLALAALSDLGLTGKCAVFSARHGHSYEALVSIATQAWNLEAISADYSELIARYHGFAGAKPDLSDEVAFVAQTLLIHGYRRILLPDPALPDELLPKKWPGHHARSLVRELYQLWSTGSERHVRQNVEDAASGNPALSRFA